MAKVCHISCSYMSRYNNVSWHKWYGTQFQKFQSFLKHKFHKCYLKLVSEFSNRNTSLSAHINTAWLTWPTSCWNYLCSDVSIYHGSPNVYTVRINHGTVSSVCYWFPRLHLVASRRRLWRHWVARIHQWRRRPCCSCLGASSSVLLLHCLNHCWRPSAHR